MKKLVPPHSMCSRVDPVCAVEYVPGTTIVTDQASTDQPRKALEIQSCKVQRN